MKNLLKLLTKALMVLMVAMMFTACDPFCVTSACEDGSKAPAETTPAETTPTKVTGNCREGDAYCECHMTDNGILGCELNWHMYD